MMPSKASRGKLCFMSASNSKRIVRSSLRQGMITETFGGITCEFLITLKTGLAYETWEAAAMASISTSPPLGKAATLDGRTSRKVLGKEHSINAIHKREISYIL